MERTMLERDLELYFYDRVKRAGGLSIKLIPIRAGFPDRLIVLPGGQMRFVELKTETGHLRPIQRVWHERARQLGVHVDVLYGPRDVREWLSAALDGEAFTSTHPDPIRAGEAR